MTVGDQLYVSFSEAGDLLVGVNEMLDGVTELDDFAYIELEYEKYTFLEKEIRL